MIYYELLEITTVHLFPQSTLYCYLENKLCSYLRNIELLSFGMKELLCNICKITLLVMLGDFLRQKVQHWKEFFLFNWKVIQYKRNVGSDGYTQLTQF